MRFEVHQSHRLEDLLARLEARLGTEPLPPLQWETILVPAQGLARWVQLRLAERAGIAAGIRLPFLGGFLQDLCHRATAGGEPGSEPGADPFARETLVWRLWRLLGNQALQTELGPAAAYVADDPDGSKRFQLCTRLAACFDDYQLYRSDLLLAFARGQEPKKLPHAGWQAQLWRALLRDAGGEPVASPRPRKTRTKVPVDAPWLFPELAAKPAPTDVPPAHRLERLRELLRDPLRAKALLPRRLSVFGAQTLPPAFLRLLQQMAVHVPVDLYVPLPTAHYIGDLRARGERSTDHPLLAGWGTEAREFADLLADLEDGAGSTEPLRRADADGDDGDADDTAKPPPSLLACLQQDIRNVTDRAARGGPGKLRLARDDDSLRVHDCHSPQRELEVVRDQILARFDTDPTLQPHDVLVLVPDIDRYAPYAHAVFGPVAEHLPFHIADRNPARDLPICKALLELLHLASSRLRTFDVLHLLEEPSLRRRFGLVASDLPLLRSACERAGIRWGLDGVSRQQQHGVPAFEENSWRLGLDRLVLGAATGPGDQLVAGLLPTADTTESRLVLLDRFVTFAETLFARLAVLRSPWPLAEWSRLLDALLADFFAPEGAADDVAVAHLHKATAALRTTATTARCDEAIPPVVLRDWLLGALHQGSGSRGFLAGAVTVAAMLPMRTVPARCLFVCGLDDASFPRRDTPAPFDLIAADRRPGDRSRRLDDRQMFLDALLAARQCLHLTFVGHSAKDDAPCAPSVVLAELLEHVDRTCVPPPGFPTARDFVVVRQPLQPWSHRYRSDQDPRLFTFTRQGKGAHVAPVPERPWHPEVMAPPAAIAGVQEIRLADLLDFWNNPSRHFVRQTMQLSLPRDTDRDDENEPFALHNLDKYRLQDSALDRALRGEALREDAFALARAEGLLPVGGHGEAVFADLAAQTERFLRIALAHHAKGCRSVVARGPDFVVTGEVEGLGPDELVRIRTAKMKPRDKLKAWLLHLVLAVARHQGASDLPCRTRVIALDEVRLVAPLDLDTAREHLAVLIAGYRSGLLAPLPFFEHSSHAYGTALHKSPDRTAALRKARGKWEPADQAEARHAHDDSDGDVQLCMRGRDPMAETRFRDLAATIWTVAESHLHLVAEDHKA